MHIIKILNSIKIRKSLSKIENIYCCTIVVQPKGDGHFGERYAWLDYIPPLQGPQAIRQPCQYTITANPTSTRRSAPCTQVKVTSSPTAIRRSTPAMQTKVKTPCSCFWCREVLLKLQVNKLCPSCSVCALNCLYLVTFYADLGETLKSVMIGCEILVSTKLLLSRTPDREISCDTQR